MNVKTWPTWEDKDKGITEEGRWVWRRVRNTAYWLFKCRRGGRLLYIRENLVGRNSILEVAAAACESYELCNWVEAKAQQMGMGRPAFKRSTFTIMHGTRLAESLKGGI